MSLLHRFLRLFFWHFYHGFAWTYDAVAAVVSLGRWNKWVQSAIPFVRGESVLEIGHGPGHLQIYLRAQGHTLVAGLDESSQMGHMARKRLIRQGQTAMNLTRGVGQGLPFASGTFDTVVSTFPAEYIFETATMHEVRRVLADGGRFVLIPAAWIVGGKALDRAAAWLFRATGQAPRLPAEVFGEGLRGKFEQAGFAPKIQTVELGSSVVLILLAEVASFETGKGIDGHQGSRAS